MDNIQTLWGHRQPALMVDDCVGCLWFKISKKYDFNFLRNFWFQWRLKEVVTGSSIHVPVSSLSEVYSYFGNFAELWTKNNWRFDQKIYQNHCAISCLGASQLFFTEIPMLVQIIMWKRFSVGMAVLDQHMKALQFSQQQLFSPIVVFQVRNDFSSGSAQRPTYKWTWLTHQIVDCWGLWGSRASELKSTTITQSGNILRNDKHSFKHFQQPSFVWRYIL